MILYFFAIIDNSFKFLQTVPDGLFGEFNIKIIFLLEKAYLVN